MGITPLTRIADHIIGVVDTVGVETPVSNLVVTDGCYVDTAHHAVERTVISRTVVFHDLYPIAAVTHAATVADSIGRLTEYLVRFCDIRASINGGYTHWFVLFANVSNDGGANVSFHTTLLGLRGIKPLD